MEIEDGVDEIPDWEAGDVPPRIGTVSGQGRPATGRLGVGDYVCHSTFGKGRITEVMPRGRSTSVRVNFELAGPKTLVLEYANLERL